MRSALYNLDTGEVVRNRLKTEPVPSGLPGLLPCAITDDGALLVQIGTVGEGLSRHARYAILPFEDYVAGNPNYTAIEPYEIPIPVA